MTFNFLRNNFSNDQGASRAGKIILRNETVSSTYTTQVIADIIKEEAHGRFESRVAVPGHFQQGSKPSPMDRIRALRMAIKCMLHVESYVGKSPDEIAADDQSASVIGTKGSQVLFSPMGGSDGLEATETNWAARRPTSEFWLKLQDSVNVLSGRSNPEHNLEEGWSSYQGEPHFLYDSQVLTFSFVFRFADDGQLCGNSCSGCTRIEVLCIRIRRPG